MITDAWAILPLALLYRGNTEAQRESVTARGHMANEQWSGDVIHSGCALLVSQSLVMGFKENIALESTCNLGSRIVLCGLLSLSIKSKF